MNVRYKIGDYEARHHNPVWQERADFIITALISIEPNKNEWEQLWARRVHGNHFEVCCIPFFTYDLSLGDEVEVDENHVFCRVSKPSGHFTFRAWFGESNDPEDRNRLSELLRTMHCEFEWSSANLMAIDAATHEIAVTIAEMLAELQADGKLTFETGHTA